MNISIFGLGYVGAVSVACLARDGHRVVGVDIDQAKLELIAAGKTPVVEEGMVELMATVVATGRVSVTKDVVQAVRATELSLVCVGTPSAPNGSQDQTAMLRLAHELGAALRTKARSARRGLPLHARARHGGRRASPDPRAASRARRTGESFHVCFQPEFLREGSSIRDYDKPPFTVVGRQRRAAASPRCARSSGTCRASSTRPRSARRRCSSTAATTSTRSRSPSPTRPPGSAKRSGVDPFEVMDLVCRDTQLNISRAYLKPGFAFGGSCLPKDLRATTYLAKIAGRGAADARRHHAVEPHPHRARDRQGPRPPAASASALVGLSFKAGTDDLRESPLVTLAEHLIGKGLQLLVYDPEVQLSRLLGANRRFIESTSPAHRIAALRGSSDGDRRVRLPRRRHERRADRAHAHRARARRPGRARSRQHWAPERPARPLRRVVLVNGAHQDTAP